MELLLVRHGNAVAILEGVEGPADPPLSDIGREQARRLAAWYEGSDVSAVVASPLQRAAQTAEVVAEALGVDVEVVDDLAEYDRHSLTYVPEALLDRDDPRIRAMYDHGVYSVDEASEDPEEFRQRAVATIEGVVERYPGARVAVVCHGGVINAYAGHVLGLSRLLWFLPENCSVTRVAAARSGQRSLLSLNETGHLIGRRDPA